MKWSFAIARVAGTEVRVHATFFLLLAFYGAVSWQEGGVGAAASGVLFILLLFLCVLLHEFGHALAARGFGIRTPDITLLPIGGVARIERMPRNPVQELAVAVAGPAVNIGIAAVLFLVVGRFVDWKEMLDVDRVDAGRIFGKLMVVNIWLVLFNMVPAFPMDGGRVLRALLAMRLRYDRATEVAARVGQAVAVLFLLWGFFGGNFLLVFIGVFVFFGAQQELLSARILYAVSGEAKVSSVMLTQFATLAAEATLGEARGAVLRTMQPVFPVVDERMRSAGLVDRQEVLEDAGDDGRRVGEIAREVPAVRAEDRFQEAIERLQQGGGPVAPVVNAQGQLVGLVSMEMLLERARLRH